MLETGQYATSNEIAKADRINLSYVSRVLRLTLLSPAIVEAAVDGRLAPDATLAVLAKPFGPLWRDQKFADRLALFRKAAEQDVPGAQFDLGLMHFLGNGAPADYGEAFYWFSLASSAAAKEHAQLRATADYMRHQAKARLSKEEAAKLGERIKTRQKAQSR